MHGVQQLYLIGSVFQFFGVSMVFFQIYAVHGLFHQHQPLTKRSKATIAKLAPSLLSWFHITAHSARPQNISLGGRIRATSSGSGQISLSATGTATVSSETDTEEVAYLRTVINQLHMSFTSLDQKVDRVNDDVSKLQQVVSQLAQKSDDVGFDLLTKLKAVALGSTRYQLASALLILFGIILLGLAGIISVPKPTP